MSASGKSLLGLWLYRSGEGWNVKENCPIATITPKQVILLKEELILPPPSAHVVVILECKWIVSF